MNYLQVEDRELHINKTILTTLYVVLTNISNKWSCVHGVAYIRKLNIVGGTRCNQYSIRCRDIPVRHDVSTEVNDRRSTSRRMRTALTRARQCALARYPPWSVIERESRISMAWYLCAHINEWQVLKHIILTWSSLEEDSFDYLF